MFGRDKLLLTLSRNGFILEKTNSSHNLSFTFDPQTYLNLEVVDRDKFVSLLTNFIQKNKLKNKDIIIYLQEEIIFQKDFPSEEAIELEIKQSVFIDEVPFETVLFRLYVNPKTKLHRMVAVNGQLIEAIRHGFDTNGNHVTAAIPVNIFNFISDKLNQPNVDVRRVLSNSKLIKEVNLIDVVREKNDEPQNVDKASFKALIKNRIFQLVLIALSFSSSAILFLMAFGLVKNPFDSPPPSPLPTPAVSIPAASDSAITVSVSPTPVSSEEVSPRPEFTIEITNGTGKAGEAAKVKDLLEAKGYKTNLASTTLNQTNSTARLSFSTDVPLLYQEEINNELKTLFTEVIIVETPITTPKTILITTGLQKPVNP